MKTRFRVTAPRLFVAIGVITMAWSTAHVIVSAQGQPVIQTFPSPGVQGPPFYANFAATFMPTDGETVDAALPDQSLRVFAAIGQTESYQGQTDQNHGGGFGHRRACDIERNA